MTFQIYVTTKPSARLMGNIRRLEKELRYTFKHPWLCMQAITHPSWTMFDRVREATLLFWNGVLKLKFSANNMRRRGVPYQEMFIFVVRRGKFFFFSFFWNFSKSTVGKRLETGAW